MRQLTLKRQDARRRSDFGFELHGRACRRGFTATPREVLCVYLTSRFEESNSFCRVVMITRSSHGEDARIPSHERRIVVWVGAARVRKLHPATSCGVGMH